MSWTLKNEFVFLPYNVKEMKSETFELIFLTGFAYSRQN